jgi:hypothetical protein
MFILLLILSVVPAATVTVAQLCMAETRLGASSFPAPAAVKVQGVVARSETAAAAAMTTAGASDRDDPRATSFVKSMMVERSDWIPS